MTGQFKGNGKQHFSGCMGMFIIVFLSIPFIREFIIFILLLGAFYLVTGTCLFPGFNYQCDKERATPAIGSPRDLWVTLVALTPEFNTGINGSLPDTINRYKNSFDNFQNLYYSNPIQLTDKLQEYVDQDAFSDRNIKEFKKNPYWTDQRITEKRNEANANVQIIKNCINL